MNVFDLQLPPDLTLYHPDTFRGASLPHLTGVRDWLDQRLGITKADYSVGGWESAATVGFFFEDAIGEVLARQGGALLGLIPGVELERDGILMSPDRLHPETMEPWDFKFTWRGLKRSPPERVWKWMVQLKGYAYGLGVDSAVIAALYCCGTYAPPQPIWVCKRFVFTPSELEENWVMLKNGARAMETAEKVSNG